MITTDGLYNCRDAIIKNIAIKQRKTAEDQAVLKFIDELIAVSAANDRGAEDIGEVPENVVFAEFPSTMEVHHD